MGPTQKIHWCALQGSKQQAHVTQLHNCSVALLTSRCMKHVPSTHNSPQTADDRWAEGARRCKEQHIRY